MLTLTYGYKKPEAGDQGTVLFDALADNIQKTNDHSHNGTNSALLTSAALTVVTQAVLATGWVLVGNGTYSQLVTMTGGTQFDNSVVSFKDTASGNPLALSVARVGPTSYTIFINDNTLNITASYGI